jgi:acetyl-CoA carboxylase carboxyltransferase component
MSARERINSLVDANSFVEIGALVTKRSTDFNMQEKAVPADGVITGYGTVDSQLIYVYSQDVTAMSGSIGEMHAKKIVGIYNMAMKVGAPVIGLIDCAGLRLQEAVDALAGFGDLYYSQGKASGIVPQISAIFGSCGGGVAISSVLSDFTFIENNHGKIFVNSPNILEGAESDTAQADFQAAAGNVDFVCEGEEEIMNNIRELISILPSHNESDAYSDENDDDMNRLIPDFENIKADPTAALSSIADGNVFIETKADFAKDIVTGYLTLNGVTVGAIANRTAEFDENGKTKEKYEGVLTADGCYKAECLVKFCDAFGIPIITLTNVIGYASTVEEEKRIARASAKLLHAFVDADTPKINVIVGNAFGSAYIIMNSKHIGADFVFALESAKVGMMKADVACIIMEHDEVLKSNEALAEKKKEYEEIQNNVEAAARRGYVDSVIPADAIRKHLIYSVDMLYSKLETGLPKKHGTV